MFFVFNFKILMFISNLDSTELYIILLVFLLWQEDNFGGVGTAETSYNILGYLSYKIAILNSKSE